MNPTTTTDPRRGLPSASALYQYANCAASHKMSKAAEAAGMVPSTDDIAASGDRIHKYLETGEDVDFEVLTHGEREAGAICMSMRDRVIAEWEQGNAPGIDYRERRLGLTRMGSVTDVTDDNRDVDFVFTGMADIILVAGHRCLIIDYKTGPMAVEEAIRNDQLRGLAVLAAGKFKLKEVTVCIIQPLCGAPSVAVYDEALLEHASMWLDSVLEELGNDHEPEAGDWCQYCDARLGCDTFRNSVHSQVATLVAGSEPDSSVIFAKALDLPNDKLARLLKGKRMIGWYLQAIEGAANLRIERGEEIPGFILKEKNGRRKIEDTDKASARLVPVLIGAEGGPQAALLRAAQLRPSKLQEEIQKASGKKNARLYNLTQKDAKALLSQCLGDLMEVPKIKSLTEVGWLEDDGGDDE